MGIEKTRSRGILTGESKLESSGNIFLVKSMLPHNISVALCPQIKNEVGSMELDTLLVANRAGQLETNLARLCEASATRRGRPQL